MEYRFEPISQETADAVRETLRAVQYPYPASASLATGYGPCRLCLRTFRVGEEERILFTYNPATEGAIPQPGPVFIHRDDCPVHRGSGVPDEIRALPLFVEGQGDSGWTIHREPVNQQDIEGALDRVFSHPGVSAAQLRNSEAGCFIAAVRRVA